MPRDRYDDEDVYEPEEYDEGEDHAAPDEDDDDGQPRGSERVRSETRQRAGGLGGRLGFEPARPGQQDIVRSPVVLILGGGAAVLALLAAIYGFMILREGASREYEAAVAEMDRGSYSIAIQMFENFLASHPADHKLVPEVKMRLGKSRILQQVNGATPDWTEGLKAMQDFIAANRDLEGYDEQKDELRTYAEQICRGAAEQAVAQRRNSLLDVSPGLIKVSQEALVIVNRLSPADEKPETLIIDIEALNERAQAKILRQEVFVQHVKEIEAALKAGQPIEALEARRRLLERYSDFGEDRELQALMGKMLGAEKELLQTEDIDREAIREPLVPPDLPTLTLTIRTRSRSDEVANGRVVLVQSKHCLYGIDMATGDPIWRQVIGLNPPFFPLDVSASVPALLTYHSEAGQLLLLQKDTGQLLWRQQIGEVVSAAPVVQEGHIYLVTQGQHLYKINVESGTITRRLKFSQPILSTPAWMDGKLVIGGQFAVLYTVDPRSLDCVAVSYIGHGAGEFRAPMLPMGKLLLLAENHQSDAARLRVLRWNAETSSFTTAATREVPGQVIDPMVLRGNQLLVPSTGRRIAVFTISDDADTEPIVPLANTEVEGQYTGPIYLDAGPDGMVWMATDSLRQLEIRQQTINLAPESTAEGIATQPLQRIGEFLYMARRLPFTWASYLSEIDRNSLTGYWRTVVGGAIREVIPREDGSLICVTETGHVFRLTSGDLDQKGFLVEPLLTLRLPDDLTTELFVASLAGGRTAVAAGGEDPRVWLLTSAGQLERQVRVAEPLQLPPVPMERGLLAAVSGKLQLIGRPSGTARVQDYIVPVEQGVQMHWRHLLPLGEDQALAFDDQQRLFRVQYRKTPVSHVAEVATLKLEAPVDARPAVSGDRLYLASAAGKLSVLSAASFETIAAVDLPGPATNAVWVLGDLVLAEVTASELVAYRLGQTLEPLWRLQLEGGGLAGPPLDQGARMVLQQRQGQVLVVGRDDGQVVRKLELNQPLEGAPLSVGDSLFAMTIDGTLYRLDAAMQPGN